MNPAPRIGIPSVIPHWAFRRCVSKKAKGQSDFGRAQGLVAVKKTFLHEESFCHPF
jgi:hypothetical protein